MNPKWNPKETKNATLKKPLIDPLRNPEWSPKETPNETLKQP